MTRKVKVYKIAVPFNLKEWRRGSRYILSKITTSEVQIIYHGVEGGEGSITTRTHKVIDTKKKMPYVVRKLIPENACIVDEFSSNVDTVRTKVTNEEGNEVSAEIYNAALKFHNAEGIIQEIESRKAGMIEGNKSQVFAEVVKKVGREEGEGAKMEMKAQAHAIEGIDTEGLLHDAAEYLMNTSTTVYKNRFFEPSSFRLEVKTIATTTPGMNMFNIDVDFKEEDIDFRTYSKPHIMRAGERDYSGNWKERYECLTIYKMVDVTVEKFGFGWIAGEVDKMLRNLLIDVQRNIIETYEEWKDLTEEELQQHEAEMVKKFVVDVK